MISASKRNKYILILSVVLNVLTVCFFVGKRIYYGYQGYRQNHRQISADSLKKRQAGYDAYTMNMISIFKAMPIDSNGIVFLGTSLTQWFPVQEAFKDATIQNRGIAANTTANILNRLGDIIESKPRKIFIEGGANDVTKIPTDSIYNNLTKIFGMIKSGTPATKIYYQSVLPFGDRNTRSIEELNNKVEIYCKANDIVFINLYPDFLRGTAMKKELTIDGTHLTGKGYSLWANDIRKYVID